MFKLFSDFKKILTIVGFILATGSTSLGQTSAPTDSIANILAGKEADMFHVILTGDKAAADKMIGQDYMTIDADGAMEDKAEMMKTFGRFKGATVKLSDKRIRTYGNLAIITGGARFYIKSILAAKVFYTETWVYRDHQWYFIGWQGTMTGLPSYYPVMLTVIGLFILYLLIRFIRRMIRKKRVTAP